MNRVVTGGNYVQYIVIVVKTTFQIKVQNLLKRKIRFRPTFSCSFTGTYLKYKRILCKKKRLHMTVHTVNWRIFVIVSSFSGQLIKNVTD